MLKKKHSMLAVGKRDFTDIANHFFALGLKAMKGECIMKKILFSLYIKYKIKFNRPIYRVDILRYVKYVERYLGLCYSIFLALIFCKVNVTTIKSVGHFVSGLFPLMDRKNAEPFNARPLASYWWSTDDWTGGRMDFLNWLIYQYKDDKTDLKKLR